MSIVLECKVCRSRFRFSTALFQGARVARVRCRTCGKLIMVRNREAPDPQPAVRPEPKSDPLPAPVPTSLPATAPPKTETVPLEEAVMPLPAARPTPRGRRRPFHSRPSFFIAAFLLLLSAGGATYFGFTTAGQRQLSRGWESLTRGTAIASPAYDIRNVEGYFTRKAGGETLYVLKGTVGNAGKSRDGKIRVRAILLDNRSRPLAETMVYAGNVLDEGLLPLMDRAEIEAAMASAPQNDASRNIPPREALPFTVVFVDPPDTMVSFQVTAFDAK